MSGAVLLVPVPVTIRPCLRSGRCASCTVRWSDVQSLLVSVTVVAGVRFPGLIHPGLIGTAPSQELLDIWNERERALVEEGENSLTLGKHLHTRPLALLPQTTGCLLGKVRT